MRESTERRRRSEHKAKARKRAPQPKRTPRKRPKTASDRTEDGGLKAAATNTKGSRTA